MNKNFTDMLKLLTLCSEPGNQSQIHELLSGISAFRTSGVFRSVVLLNAFLRQMRNSNIIGDKDYHSLELLCNTALDYLEKFKE